MYDNKALNGRRASAPSSAQDASRGGYAAAVRPSEAELLRVIEKALEEQRKARAKAETPLTSRIEAILAPHLTPANDAPSQPATVEKPPVQAAAASQLPEPVFAPANTNDIPAAVVDDEPLRLPLKPIAYALAGLMLGAAFPLMMPQAPVRYAAATVLHVGGDTATRPALTQAAAKKLVSGPVIAATVASLKLDRDPEFAGEKPNAVGIAFDLLSGNGAAADAASRAEASLAAAVESVPDGGTGLVRLNVSTASAEKSRQISARLSGMLLAAPAGDAAGSDGALKKAYEQARAELDAFTARTGEGNVRVAADLQQRINQLDADLKVGEQRITLSKERADRLKAAKPADVVDGVLPSDMISPVLQDARDRYAAEKATLSQLSIDLGPRHPKLLAQQAIVDGLRDKLSRELSVQAKDAAVDAKMAVDARRKLSDERNGLIAQSRDTGVDLAKLTELRDKTDAAKSRLDTALPQAGMGDSNISMQAAPQVFAVSTGYSTSLRSAIGGGIGLILGLAAFMLSGLFRNRQEDPLDLLDIPAVIEPSVAQQFALEPELEPEPEQPDDIELLRAELAELRSRFQSYAATGR